ncbi:hypothetical protein F1880_002552 [Penicillium rolfsii]|nr:hypothetical protein F1880_002552 [Penicillium rolfsii]
METVSKVVSAATAALWGDGSTAQQQTTPHGEEPIAGVQGKGNFNDPFDAGNREEQPQAPTSEVNTAPQEPRLDGAKTDPSRKDLVADTKTDKEDYLEKTIPTAPIAPPPTLTAPALSPVPVTGASASTSSATPVEADASRTAVPHEPKTTVPIAGASASSSSAIPAEAGTSRTAVPHEPATTVPIEGASASSSSATPAEAGASRTAVPNEPESKTEHEQRTTESASGQSSKETPHAAKHHEVSEEALKGPQGPAPVPMQDFEQEAKGLKSVKSDRGASKNESSKGTEKGSHGNGNGNGNGKHSPLHKMKEKLSKVVHPGHGSHKA